MAPGVADWGSNPTLLCDKNKLWAIKELQNNKLWEKTNVSRKILTLKKQFRTKMSAKVLFFFQKGWFIISFNSKKTSNKPTYTRKKMSLSVWKNWNNFWFKKKLNYNIMIDVTWCATNYWCYATSLVEFNLTKKSISNF